MNYKFLVCALPVIGVGLTMGGCSSDPYSPVNQSTPIRQMDNAFDPSGSRYEQGTAYPPPTHYYDRGAPAQYPRGYAPPSYSR